METNNHSIKLFSKTALILISFTVAAIVLSTTLTVFIRNEVVKRDLKRDLNYIGLHLAESISGHCTASGEFSEDLDLAEGSDDRENIIRLCSVTGSIFKLTYAGVFVPSEENGYISISDYDHSHFSDLYPSMSAVLSDMFSTNSTESRFDCINGTIHVCFTPIFFSNKTVCIVCTAADLGKKTGDVIFIAAVTAALAIILLVSCELITLYIIDKQERQRISAVISEIRTSTAEKIRTGADLDVATKIQADMLPTRFPVTGNIELYADMTPAKEVGGDFYDFFNIDRDHIAMVMADVSGKGVPAALFMVIAKTLIQDRALMGRSPARVLEYANNRLCENNDSGLFVTAWVGVLELSTGNLTYSSAGHEYPVFRRDGGRYEMVTEDNEPPLAAMENMEYSDTKTVLKPGDSLFLYTDGVPEAKNPSGKRFGTDKMLEVLNEDPESSSEDIIKRIRTAIDDFDAGSDPFDDVTIMCLKYFGKN
ncbi:MAG: PP2C family protein-serine/threonine phosphatase [Ruminiclostridium sp.]|nr:PP2C family protein-serine/threonine phosphatase [Ruminiclostridium sp.]